MNEQADSKLIDYVNVLIVHFVGLHYNNQHNQYNKT